MRKRSRVLDDDDDDDDDNKQVGARNVNDSSSSDEEPDSSSSSSSSSSSDDERTPRKRQTAKDRGKGSMSQMKESADREKARIEKGRSSSSQPPKKRGRPSNRSGIDDDDDEYTEKGGSGKDMVTRDEHDRLVSMTIQLFLYSNTHKRPIKREDIGEYVLKDYKGRKSLRKLSKSVFDEAVAKIKDIFGYDVKVLKKPVVKGDIATAPSTAVFYVLVNSLTKHQEEEEEKEKDNESEKEKDSENESEEEENEDSDGDDDKKVSKKNKRVEETLVPITLRSDVDAAHHGLLMVILGIIVLSNGIIQEETLFEKLRMAKVGRGSPDNDVDDPVFKSVRDVVSSFVSQQYLTRIKTKGAKKTDDAVKNIVIGPRTIAEFDLKRIAVFVMRMFGIKEPSEKYLRAILSTQCPKDSN